MSFLDLRDDRYLFDGISLSKEELKKREIQQSILAMAKDKYRFNHKEDGYRMPEGYEDSKGRIDKEKREGALTARYEEELQPKSEQVSASYHSTHTYRHIYTYTCTHTQTM
jgi:hypothetical protein